MVNDTTRQDTNRNDRIGHKVATVADADNISAIQAIGLPEESDLFDRPAPTRRRKAKMSGDGLTMKAEASSSGSADDRRAMFEAFVQQMGVPKLVRTDKKARILNEIYNLVGAKSKSDKELVEYALTYLFTVHGASVNVDWSSIDLIAGGGTRPVKMNHVVRVVGTHDGALRKFAASFSDKAIEIHDETPAVRESLRERTVRVGLPMTDTKAAIDFLTLDEANPYAAGLRVQGKYRAVDRAEESSKRLNSVANASERAVRQQARTITSNGHEDSLGPLE